MDLINYVFPINDKKNKKKSGYKITDNAVCFYYRYIYHNLFVKNIISDDLFYEKYIVDDFMHSVVPKTFEKISKEYLIRKNRKGLISPYLEDIGTYWYDNPKEKKNGQFDLVTKSSEGFTIYEVKYRNSKIDNKIVEEEIEQLKNINIQRVKLGFISKSGFNISKDNDYILITLDDIYNLD